MSPPVPDRILLDDPGLLLRWIASDPAELDFDRIDVCEIWGLVALATLGRRERGTLSIRETIGETGASRFAHALGLDEVVAGTPPIQVAEPERTVKLTRLRDFSAIEPAANQISRLLIARDDLADTRKAVSYVLVELLRNVLQHSQDDLGAVVAAQVRQRGSDRSGVQIAVGDAGIGIFKALAGMHPDLQSPEAALERALWPHLSGSFERGLTGSPSQSNAGLGLFFISEIAKLELGKLMISSRGATLILEGGEEPDQHGFRFLQPTGLGFPGTLVAFEIPLGEIADYEGLMGTIQRRAQERQPKRQVHHWLRFEAPPPTISPLLVRFICENTQAASETARELEPRLFRRDPVALDFRNIEICTQSFLHALLYAPLRLAWARQAPIYIVNAAPAVRSGLEFLESYALGG